TGRGALAAWLPGAPVDPKRLLEVARFAGGVDVVPKRGAADFDGVLEGGAHGRRELLIGRRADPAGAAQRMDAGRRQRLAGVDVAHTRHHPAVHDEALDRDSAPARE